MALTGAAVGGDSMDDVVRLEILDGGQTSDGTYVAALRISLHDGWKTYWRAPGDAGIAPQFNWRGSQNLGNVSMTWPAPEVFDQNGMQSIGYKHELVLPLEITPERAGLPVHLRGEIELGVCKDVCIPSTLSFDHSVNVDAARSPEIAAALAQRPFSRFEAGVTSAKCRISPIKDGIRIETHIQMPSAGGREVTVIEPGDPEIWVSEASSTRRGDTLISSSDLIHSSAGSFALDRSQIRITVLGDRHVVDIQGCEPG